MDEQWYFFVTVLALILVFCAWFHVILEFIELQCFTLFLASLIKIAHRVTTFQVSTGPPPRVPLLSLIPDSARDPSCIPNTAHGCGCACEAYNRRNSPNRDKPLIALHVTPRWLILTNVEVRWYQTEQT